MVGADGVTHQGSYDIAYLGCLPGFVLMAAADEKELYDMVSTQVALDDDVGFVVLGIETGLAGNRLAVVLCAALPADPILQFHIQGQRSSLKG